MAVYTDISAEELSSYLGNYDAGILKSFEGIEKGVSNTNYHVFTDLGRYILTLFEEHRTRREDLPFFFSYANHLNEKSVLCPRALSSRNGEFIHML